ncbi:MAG: hypothetical protein F6K10_11455 [Moorea sp. SIO2B7]|nr:hypothetical protein [Moorena sp. SIO2B7]
MIGEESLFFSRAETQRRREFYGVVIGLIYIFLDSLNGGNYAKQIRRIVDNCTRHNLVDDSPEED